MVAAVNFTTPADLIAAEAAAAVNAPPAPTAADQAVLNSVAAATNLTRALTDSMSQTLSALGYSPGTGVPPQPLPRTLPETARMHALACGSDSPLGEL